MPKKIAKNSPDLGQSISHRTTFEAFQLASYSFFFNRFPRVTFLGHPVDIWADAKSSQARQLSYRSTDSSFPGVCFFHYLIDNFF